MKWILKWISLNECSHIALQSQFQLLLCTPFVGGECQAGAKKNCGCQYEICNLLAATVIVVVGEGRGLQLMAYETTNEIIIVGSLGTQISISAS